MSLLQSILHLFGKSGHPAVGGPVRREVFFTKAAQRNALPEEFGVPLKRGQAPSPGRGKVIFTTPQIGRMSEDEFKTPLPGKSVVTGKATRHT